MATATIRSYAEIASNLDLWREYIDPEMAISDDEFSGMTMDQKISLIIETFGPEPTDAAIDDDLGFVA